MDDPKQLEIAHILNRYKLPLLFKGNQRAPNKSLLPYEKIDYSLYKEAANCVVFVTTVKRMPFWIYALAKTLREKEANTECVVNWKDSPRENTEKIEFNVCTPSDSEGEETELLYKVILYLTNGKIMIQGKGFKNWCEEEFSKCVTIVNNEDTTINPKGTNTSIKQADDKSETEKNESKNHADDTSETKSNEREKYADGKSASETPVVNTETDKKLIDEQTASELISDINVLKSRLTTIENSVVKFTDHVLDTHSVLKNIESAMNEKEKENTIALKSIQSMKDMQLKLFDLIKGTYIQNESTPFEHIKEAHQREINALNSRLKDNEKEREHLRARIRELEREVEVRKDAYAAESDKLKDTIDSTCKKYEAEKTHVLELQKEVKDLRSELQTINYDIEGGKWETNNPAKFTQTSSSAEVESQRNIHNHPAGASASIQNISNSGITPETDFINVDPDEISIKEDILLLHDSVCKHINMNRLTTGTTKKGVSLRSPTIMDANDTVGKMNNRCERIVMHVGINDLRNERATVPEIFSNFKILVENALKKADKVVISLPLPCEDQPLQSYIASFRSLVLSEYSQSQRVIICKNENFISNEMIIKKLYQDNIHLNSDQGTRVLAGNLKRALFGPVRDLNGPPSQRYIPNTTLGPPGRPRQHNNFRGGFNKSPSYPQTQQQYFPRQTQQQYFPRSDQIRPGFGQFQQGANGNREQNIAAAISALLKVI